MSDLKISYRIFYNAQESESVSMLNRCMYSEQFVYDELKKSLLH